MFNLIQIQQLLQEKLQLLLCFETETQKMLLCAPERLAEQVSERQKLIDRIDRIDERLKILCEESADGRALFVFLSGEGECKQLGDGVQALGGDIRSIRSILSRLKESDMQAHIRLRVEKEKILEQIKETNQGATAKAARFYSSIGVPDEFSRLGDA